MNLPNRLNQLSATFRENGGAVSIVAAFVIIATVYSVVTPVFEASDEISHFPVVQHIATTGELPIQRPGVATLWDQEGSQPPLYYMISALLTSWIDTSDLRTIRTLNPHAKLGIPLDPDNKNMILHTEAEGFPWTGTVLAVHLLRFFGVALGAATVSFTFVLAREVWPGEPMLHFLAVSLVALNPMFMFISASVNNDNLNIVLCTLTLVLCVRSLKHGQSARPMTMLAVVFALASITKISGLTLLPLILATIVLQYYRTRDLTRSAAFLAILIGAWCVIALWWYIRNVNLYNGDILGIETQVLIAGGRQISLIDLIQNESYGFWVSYWALFGSVNILVDNPIYVLYGLFSILGLLGFVWWLLRQLQGRRFDELLIPTLLLLFTLGVLIGLIRWTLTTYASQGRLMFPAIAVVSILLARGIFQIMPIAARKSGALILSGSLAAIAFVVPFTYIGPAYARSPVVNSLPTDLIPVGVSFEGLELLGIRTSNVAVNAGGFVPITLYWRASQPLSENYSIYLHAFGRDMSELGKVDSYPGAGTWPTTRMRVGDIIEDSYEIELEESVDAPSLVRIQVGVGKYSSDSYELIHGTSSAGVQAPDVFVEAGSVYPSGGSSSDFCDVERYDTNSEPTVRFGDFALLHAIQPPDVVKAGDTIALQLVWERIGNPGGDWTVFVQLLDAKQQVRAQKDGPPANGDYPTRAWLHPCAFMETRILETGRTLIPGNYSLIVGLYEASVSSLPRADAFDMTGLPYPDNAAQIATIRVEAP